MSINIKTFVGDTIGAIIDDDTPIQTLNYYYGSRAVQNLVADNLDFPVAFLDTPIRTRYTFFQSGVIHEHYDLYIMFADKTAIDATPSQQDIVVAQMRTFMNKFIRKCVNSNTVKDVVEVSSDEVYDIFDVHLCGLGLEITLTFENIDDVCL